jgi:hypothetical protein
MIVGMTAANHSRRCAAHPYLEREDVMQALQYAAWPSEERGIILTIGGHVSEHRGVEDPRR